MRVVVVEAVIYAILKARVFFLFVILLLACLSVAQAKVSTINFKGTQSAGAHAHYTLFIAHWHITKTRSILFSTK